VVGGEASGTSLADVQLPAAEIGGGWFHGFGVWVEVKSLLVYVGNIFKSFIWDNLRGFG
jgi:hypothetical protein